MRQKTAADSAAGVTETNNTAADAVGNPTNDRAGDGNDSGRSAPSSRKAGGVSAQGVTRSAAGTRLEGKASQNKRRKRESLLNNAFDLFTQKGIADTTIADIAERAGVAKGTFYLYFKDKYDLRDRLVRHKAEQILENAYYAMRDARMYGKKTNAADSDAADSKGVEKAGILDTLEDQVVFFCDNILTQLSDNRLLLKFITKNLSWGLLKHDVGSLPASSSTEEEEIDLITALKDYFKRSAVQYRNPEILLYMIVEFIGSTCYSSILNADPLPIEKLKPYLLQGVRAIMRSQECPA